jgi:hypothetical protein
MAHLRIAPVTDHAVLPLGGTVHFHPCADGCGETIVCFAADGCDATAWACQACVAAREEWAIGFEARSAQRAQR